MSDGIRYIARLFDSLFRISPTRLHAKRAPLLLTVVAICAATYGYGPAVAEADLLARRQVSVDKLRARLDKMETGLGDVEGMYTREVRPIERVLIRYRSDNPRLVRRVAVSIVKESKRAHIAPNLLVGMLLVENPMLDPHARSVAGASGLMQVMPLHRGTWKPWAQLHRIVTHTRSTC
jgi:hypothetical protein